MKEIPDKSVDLIICDLPYGCLSKVDVKLPPKTYEGNHGISTLSGCAWDIKINLEEFWKEVRRIRKN
jgi:hypothetical protein